MTCEHKTFSAQCAVARVEDIGRFVLEVKISCMGCGTPFQFIGIPPGLSYESPTVSVDGLEAHLPVCAQGVQPTPLQGLMGFTLKTTN
jgi:hypothetical protein